MAKIKAYDVISSLNDNDILLIETTNGTKTVKVSTLVKDREKVVRTKFFGNGGWDSLATCFDPTVLYYGYLGGTYARVFASQYDQVYSQSSVASVMCQYAFKADGEVLFRTSRAINKSHDPWTVTWNDPKKIGITANLEDGAVTYAKLEATLKAKIDAAQGLTFTEVTTLPTVGNANTVYLKAAQGGGYEQWMYFASKPAAERWTMIGTTQMDISTKVDKTQLVAGLALSGNIAASSLKEALASTTIWTQDLTNASSASLSVNRDTLKPSSKSGLASAGDFVYFTLSNKMYKIDTITANGMCQVTKVMDYTYTFDIDDVPDASITEEKLDPDLISRIDDIDSLTIILADRYEEGGEFVGFQAVVADIATIALRMRQGKTCVLRCNASVGGLDNQTVIMLNGYEVIEGSPRQVKITGHFVVEEDGDTVVRNVVGTGDYGNPGAGDNAIFRIVNQELQKSVIAYYDAEPVYEEGVLTGYTLPGVNIDELTKSSIEHKLILIRSEQDAQSNPSAPDYRASNRYFKFAVLSSGDYNDWSEGRNISHMLWSSFSFVLLDGLRYNECSMFTTDTHNNIDDVYFRKVYTRTYVTSEDIEHKPNVWNYGTAFSDPDATTIAILLKTEVYNVSDMSHPISRTIPEDAAGLQSSKSGDYIVNTTNNKLYYYRATEVRTGPTSGGTTTKSTLALVCPIHNTASKVTIVTLTSLGNNQFRASMTSGKMVSEFSSGKQMFLKWDFDGSRYIPIVEIYTDSGGTYIKNAYAALFEGIDDGPTLYWTYLSAGETAVNSYPVFTANSNLMDLMSKQDINTALSHKVDGENGDVSVNTPEYWSGSTPASDMMTGTYQLTGEYCTITATATAINGWLYTFYRLPVALDPSVVPMVNVIANCVAGNTEYIAKIDTTSSINCINIYRKDGQNNQGDAAVSFTITYRYTDDYSLHQRYTQAELDQAIANHEAEIERQLASI